MVRRSTRFDKRDANEGPIIAALESLGAKVYQLSGSKGLPDLLVGICGRTILAEVKDPNSGHVRKKAQRERGGLDPDQLDFFAGWPGAELYVWMSPGDAIDTVTSPPKAGNWTPGAIPKNPPGNR